MFPKYRRQNNSFRNFGKYFREGVAVSFKIARFFSVEHGREKPSSNGDSPGKPTEHHLGLFL